VARGRAETALSRLSRCSEFYTAEKEYAASHPVYTRCKAKVDMQEFVKDIRKTCGGTNSTKYPHVEIRNIFCLTNVLGL
jgi:nucleoside diphosphate kinase